jgi:hypothetical protein
MDDLSREKLNLHQIQFITNPHCFPCFSEASAAILLCITVAAGPSPPDVEKNQWSEGAMCYVPDSLIVCSFFSCSFCLYQLVREVFLRLGASRLNTVTSKNACCL